MERSIWHFSEAEQAQHTDPYITKVGLSKTVLHSVSRHHYHLGKKEIQLDFCIILRQYIVNNVVKPRNIFNNEVRFILCVFSQC